MGGLVLVLGGARSGKSRFAMRLATASNVPVVYVATAAAGDEEMAARIARHRTERPPDWRTLELPLRLDERLPREVDGRGTVLIDCLSVWLSNELLALRDWQAGEQGETAVIAGAVAQAAEEQLLAAVDRLAEYSVTRRGMTVVVSNEVGSGVVPAYPLGRLYRDVLGRANQVIAARSTAVYLVVAGIGVDLRRLQVELTDRRSETNDPDR